MHKLEKELNYLLFLIANTQKSQISYKRPVEPSRLINCYNKAFRYDIRNIIFLTKEEEELFKTNSEYRDSNLSKEQKGFINQNEFIDFQEFLMNENLTEEELLNRQKQELLKLIPTDYELYLLNKEINGLQFTKFKKKSKPFYIKDNIIILNRESKLKAKEIIKTYRKQVV